MHGFPAEREAGPTTPAPDPEREEAEREEREKRRERERRPAGRPTRGAGLFIEMWQGYSAFDFREPHNSISGQLVITSPRPMDGLTARSRVLWIDCFGGQVDIGGLSPI